MLVNKQWIGRGIVLIKVSVTICSETRLFSFHCLMLTTGSCSDSVWLSCLVDLHLLQRFDLFLRGRVVHIWHIAGNISDRCSDSIYGIPSWSSVSCTINWRLSFTGVPTYWICIKSLLNLCSTNNDYFKTGMTKIWSKFSAHLINLNILE